MTTPPVVVRSSRNRPALELFGVTADGLTMGPLPVGESETPTRSLTIVGNMGALDPLAVERMPLGAFGAGPADIGLPYVPMWVSGYAWARLTGEVRTAGASGSTLGIEARVAGSGDAFAPVTVVPVAMPLDDAGLVASPWAVLQAWAIDDIEFRVVALGGDGVAAPILGNLYLQLSA